MSIAILGVDLGKNACSIVAVDAPGAIVTRRSMRRQTLIDYVRKRAARLLGRTRASRGNSGPFGYGVAAE